MKWDEILPGLRKGFIASRKSWSSNALGPYQLFLEREGGRFIIKNGIQQEMDEDEDLFIEYKEADDWYFLVTECIDMLRGHGKPKISRREPYQQKAAHIESEATYDDVYPACPRCGKRNKVELFDAPVFDENNIHCYCGEKYIVLSTTIIRHEIRPLPLMICEHVKECSVKMCPNKEPHEPDMQCDLECWIHGKKYKCIPYLPDGKTS